MHIVINLDNGFAHDYHVDLSSFRTIIVLGNSNVVCLFCSGRSFVSAVAVVGWWLHCMDSGICHLDSGFVIWESGSLFGQWIRHLGSRAGIEEASQHWVASDTFVWWWYCFFAVASLIKWQQRCFLCSVDCSMVGEFVWRETFFHGGHLLCLVSLLVYLGSIIGRGCSISFRWWRLFFVDGGGGVGAACTFEQLWQHSFVRW